MDRLVFCCSNCKKVFVGEDYQASDRPRCPMCSQKTQSTGFTKEAWVQKSKEEREAILNALTEEKVIAEQQAAKREAYAKSVGVNYEENVKSKEESSVDGLYIDIGKKIKGWAKTIFIVEAIAFVVCAIAMLFTAEDGWVFFAAIITAVGGPMIAWVSSWILYAFGELVDKTCANERNTQNILKLMLESKMKNNQE